MKKLNMKKLVGILIVGFLLIYICTIISTLQINRNVEEFQEKQNKVMEDQQIKDWGRLQAISEEK